ncbi:peptidase M48, Ste24p [Candidatus Koribacter versatilis Ellin345]|uniref:Peptidase M48, Ste24p n=1 Tax=Koribacter versatilis (strain Ellin345) TaxID=204669 RepID=Q1INI2_KORVE|nr:M48 family metallopeptidase [Candidatus Koribacter versatilis]ABF41568.1 peptidase M48, Ste24p [Candidatus Koribacter versatilis Ellin345]
MKLKRLLVTAAFALSSFGMAQSAPAHPDTQSQQPAATQGGETPDAQQAPADDSTAAPAAGTDSTATKDPLAKEATENLPKASGVKHDGSRDDVSAIGNRHIGQGTSPGDWYSLEKEIRMGKGYSEQIEAGMKLVQDPVVTEYVNRIGQNIVRNSDARVPFTIKVVDSDEINAFALPGGFFYVNSGLILAADEEAELAGVMAHEIAHVAARHATRQMTRGQIANLATIPLIFVGGGLGYALQSAVSLALPMTFLKFSRGFEAEADYLGLQYMYATGYDPQAFISFFEKVQAKEKKKPGTLAKAFSTHPQTPDRIEKSQEEIARILPARDQYIDDTSEFQTVKSRLAALENRHKVEDQKENRPTLRRTTADNTGSTDSKGTNDDDRPTLKKRDD